MSETDTQSETMPQATRPNRKLLAYVSGPYRDSRGTAFVEENIRRSEDMAKRLWCLGYAVICPHANTRHFDGIVGPQDFIDGDLVMVERCDLVVVLPDSDHSQGTQAEINHAIRHSTPVFKFGLGFDRKLWDSLARFPRDWDFYDEVCEIFDQLVTEPTLAEDRRRSELRKNPA